VEHTNEIRSSADLVRQLLRGIVKQSNGVLPDEAVETCMQSFDKRLLKICWECHGLFHRHALSLIRKHYPDTGRQLVL